MNLHGTLTRPSTPTYPNPPQKYYSNTKNRVLSNENIFHTRLKEPITWHAHLTHLNKKSRPLWIQICYFFSKLKRVLSISLSLWSGFIFPYFITFFPIVNKPFFSSSGRFLFRSRLYYCCLPFSSSASPWYVWRAFLEVFLCFLNI